MADTTWGVKVPEELKEKVTEAMQNSGLSSKEFVENLLQTYELSHLKETQSVISPDIDELQALTLKILYILLIIHRFPSLGFMGGYIPVERCSTPTHDFCKIYSGQFIGFILLIILFKVFGKHSP